jgi:hypothetical protein
MQLEMMKRKCSVHDDVPPLQLMSVGMLLLDMPTSLTLQLALSNVDCGHLVLVMGDDGCCKNSPKYC